MHQIALPDGTLTDARNDTATGYDQGAPHDHAGDAGGWALGQVTTSTDAGGLALPELYQLLEATGHSTQTRRPPEPPGIRGPTS